MPETRFVPPLDKDDKALFSPISQAWQTAERKYMHFASGPTELCLKRCLAPSEWKMAPSGRYFAPIDILQRLKNEAAALDFVSKNTSIPVPRVVLAFEDAGRFYLITEMVKGAPITDVPVERRQAIFDQLEAYQKELHSIRSKSLRGMAGTVCFPHRIGIRFTNAWIPEYAEDDKGGYPLCHGDLSQSNVLVDPDTWKITAVIDWEYAGFYPVELEGQYYRRQGPSDAIDGEHDDVPAILDMLKKLKVPMDD